MVSILAFDYGDKRIGVAHYDGVQVIPLQYLATDDFDSILPEMIDTYMPQSFIVGLPRTLEGEETHQTTKAKAFADNLGQKTGIDTRMQDEALSSERASELLPPKLTAKQQRQRIDSLAASIILQDYLDERNAP